MPTRPSPQDLRDIALSIVRVYGHRPTSVVISDHALAHGFVLSESEMYQVDDLVDRVPR